MDTPLQTILTEFQQGQCSQEDALRAILAYPSWRVYVDEAGQPEVVPSDDGTAFLIAESTADEGQIWDGRSLVQTVAPNFGGIVFDPDEPWAILFKPEALAELQRWAQIVELEKALLEPAPDQTNTLLTGPWWGVVTPGSDQLAVYRDQHREGVRSFSLDAVTLLTAPDAAETFNRTDRHRGLEVVELGPELWQELAHRIDYDGIRVNPCTPRYQLLPPHLPRSLLAGHDVRIGAEPLPARTIAEIELWLDLMGARPDKRSQTVQTASPGAAAVEYEAWWGYASRKLLFTLSEPYVEPPHLGDSPSRILCAGLLIRFARGKLAGLPRFRWQAKPAHRQRAAAALRVLDDLSKLMTGDSIPFAALRTPEGAYLWHLEPETFTASAIAELRRRAAALA